MGRGEMGGGDDAYEARKSLRIGVLALQGAFAEHIKALRDIGVKDVVEVRKPEELTGLDGLIIPGGESTVMSKLALRWGLMDPLREMVGAGAPVWGTCAGLILLADKITAESEAEDRPPTIGGMRVEVNRNHFGGQLQSFEGRLTVLEGALQEGHLGTDPMWGMFIRAPAVAAVLDSKAVQTLATVYDKRTEKDIIVAVRQGNLLATAFHPELSDDRRWHIVFADMVTKNNADLVTKNKTAARH